MNLNNEFLVWIKPLLYKSEYEILLYHLQAGNKGFKIKNSKQALAKYNMSKYQLYETLIRLEFFARLYERLAGAGVVKVEEG